MIENNHERVAGEVQLNMFFDTKKRKILVFDLHRMEDEKE